MKRKFYLLLHFSSLHVKNAIDYIESREDLRGDVILYGRSLGGAVVIDLAARAENENIKAVMVENTFSSIPNMGCQLFPFLAPIIKRLPEFAIKNKFYSIFKGMRRLLSDFVC